MKASDYIVSFIEQQGIDTIFGYIGGMITHLVDSISKNEKVKYVQTYHEQTAAIAAEGYAIESGLFGVAISTSGPGVTNMMTGIADAYFDSIPVLYISGQVNSYEYKYDKPIRQQGFQEMDVISIIKPITKYAVLVDDADNLKYELEKAIYYATNGRKGPVLLDIPMNIQRSEINPDKLRGFIPPFSNEINGDIPSAVYSILSKAERPMLLIGGGCQNLDTSNKLNEFLKATSIPVVTSLMGRGIIDETYANYLGMIGSYGNRCANMGIAKADVLLVLGARLDTRQTGAMIDCFLPNSTIIHVDIDKNELEYHRIPNRLKINDDVSHFLTLLMNKTLEYKNYQDWNANLFTLKERYNQSEEIERFVENKSPYLFMEKINENFSENDVITADIGQNQMWAAQTLRLKKGQKFVTSGGLAPMGFSLPVAIGISFASPHKTIYCINGDGGFHMAIQSLLLISQYQLPIRVLIMDNQALGMITQFQHLYFDDRLEGTTEDGGYLIPDISAVATAYRLPYMQLCDDDLMDESKMAQFKSFRFGIIDYKIKGLTSVSPKLEYNKPIYKPAPLLDEDEFLKFGL